MLDPARRAACREAADLAGGLPRLAMASGATAGRRRDGLVTVDVPMATLPPHLDGLRIAHRSALHRGDCMPRAAIRRAIDLAHTAPPALMVVTGEVITSARDPLEDWVVELSRLRVPVGLWGAATATTRGGSGGRHGRRRSWRTTACPGGGSRVRHGPGAAAPST